MVKRMFDVVIAGAALVVLAPVLACIALAVRLSGGCVLYRGTRGGRNGSSFRIMKFRTMVPEAEKLGGSVTSGDDFRITRIGHWLRKYKLDELPQLINVLKGDMSLVGPRPDVPEYLARLSGDELRILNLRPGITDWASIWDSDEGELLKGCVDPITAYEAHIWPTKIRLQLFYADTCSFTTDVKILFYTAVKLLFPEWLPRELTELGIRPATNIAHGVGSDAQMTHATSQPNR